MSKIIKIIDERKMQKQKQTNKNRTRGREAIVKGWEINDFAECLS